MTALLSVGAWAGNLWTGSETLAYYGFQLTEAVSMSAGDVLTFTVTETTTDWAGIKLKTNDMTQGYATPGTELISTSATVGTVKIVVTSEVAAAAAADGLWLDGNDCTVTSVGLEQKQATLNIYSSTEGTTVNYWGTALSKAMFGAVQKGDVLKITVKSVGADWGANLSVTTMAGGDGNVELATASISPDPLPTTIQITFTDEMVTAAKNDGLYLNGGTYTYIAVNLVYASSGNDTPIVPVSDGDYAITINVADNGTVTSDHTKADAGETVTLTVTPANGYQLSKLIIEETAEPGSANVRRRLPAVGSFVTATKQNEGTWTFLMPARSVIISATFAVKTQEPTLAYAKATRTITITNTEYAQGNGVTATLHYTFNNGAEQTTTDPSVSEVITENTVVKAWIVSTETGNSDSVEETYSVAAKPTVAYSEDNNTISLTLTDATATNTADSQLYYTTDGTTPTTGSTPLSADGDIDITEDMTTVKVLGLDADGNYSEIVEQSVAYAYYLTASQEWTTYYSPKTYAVPAGLKAYTVKSVTAPADGESGTIEVTEQQVIAKNTPMLILNENAGTTDRYRVYTTADQTISGTAEQFKGVATATELPNDGTLRYVLVEGVFLRTLGDTLLPANRCYLELGSTDALVRRFAIVIDGDANGINEAYMMNREGSASSQWYDLQGRRVMLPQKGIFLKDGKKVIVK